MDGQKKKTMDYMMGKGFEPDLVNAAIPSKEKS